MLNETEQSPILQILALWMIEEESEHQKTLSERNLIGF